MRITLARRPGRQLARQNSRTPSTLRPALRPCTWGPQHRRLAINKARVFRGRGALPAAPGWGQGARASGSRFSWSCHALLNIQSHFLAHGLFTTHDRPEDETLLGDRVSILLKTSACVRIADVDVQRHPQACPARSEGCYNARLAFSLSRRLVPAGSAGKRPWKACRGMQWGPGSRPARLHHLRSSGPLEVNAQKDGRDVARLWGPRR